MDRPNDLKSLQRAIALLNVMASVPAPQSFTELCTALDMKKATCHRLLATLEASGMVRRHPATERYTLGITALRIGTAAGNQIELRRDMRSFLTELMERTGETSNLVVFEGTSPVFVDDVESIHSLRMFSRVGKRTSPYCTASGKAIMAFQQPSFVEKVLACEPFQRYTPHTLTTREELLDELAHVRAQGFAVDDEEGELGARCVGAPLLDASGYAVAAISISGPSSRVTSARVDELGRIVGELAGRAQLTLGGPHGRFSGSSTAKAPASRSSGGITAAAVAGGRGRRD